MTPGADVQAIDALQDWHNALCLFRDEALDALGSIGMEVRRAFDWIGTHAGLPRPVWQAGFAFYWMVPALLVSVLLLFRGTHLANGGHSRESS